MSLTIRPHYNSLWLILGSLFVADGWNKSRTCLGLENCQNSIVVEGNEAAYHADEFADATMWRLGYIKDSEFDSPLDGTEDPYTQNFKRFFLKVYGKTVDRFAGGIPYRGPPKEAPIAVEVRNIEVTFNLYTSPPTSTATAKENENYLRYHLLFSLYSSEWRKIVREHGSSKQTWSIIDSSPVIVAIIRQLKETLSAIAQYKRNSSRAKIT
jgi:hypothetical protein